MAGNDTYVGGAGNDTLNDNSTTSNDVYHWGIGLGNDAITDAGGSADRIEMGAGVTSGQVVLTRSGNHLQVSITGASDVLTVNGWYTSSANRIEQIRLADGSLIDPGAAAPAAPAVQRAASRNEDADRQAQLLTQSMAQFGVGDALADVGPAARARHWWRADLAVPL